ncbi:MAG: PRC-barrel domain-containing protein [Sphingomonas sp.]|nr:PRC-barrel domain-containing protein [Sphingomonas sp.]
MAYDTVDRTVARSETTDLIASDKVEGTNVYNRDGEKLGSVRNFMVGKRSGRVDYAVMSFGGLFGLGERYYPLPWDTLDYDTDRGGYVVDIDKQRLEGAPWYEPGKEPTYDRVYGERVYGYYGVPF